MADCENGGTSSRFLTNLAYLVPGYHAYRDPAARREEDSRLRVILLRRLGDIRGRLNEILDDLPPEAAAIAALLDERIVRLDGIADAIRYAPYGFSGFFDADAIAEDALERILEADLLLFEDLDAIEAAIDAAPAPPRAGARLREFYERLDDGTERLERHLILRDKLLGNV